MNIIKLRNVKYKYTFIDENENIIENKTALNNINIDI